MSKENGPWWRQLNKGENISGEEMSEEDSEEICGRTGRKW